MSQVDFENLNKIMRAYRISNVFLVAYELGVLDKLSNQPSPLDKLASELGLSEKGLARLLSSLCSIGILNKENLSYQISEEYEAFLNPQSTHYIGGLINHEVHLQKRWMRLSESIKTGNPVKKADVPISSEDKNRFISAMDNLGQRIAPLVIEKIHFNGNERLLDLGGGPGKYLEKFSETYPEMQVTLFDQPETVRAAQSTLSGTKNLKTLQFISGDLFQDPFGSDYDVIFSSNVIHIFGAREIKTIFDKCYKALKPKGRLLIKDFFLNSDHTGPEFSTTFSLHMLLSTDQGQCYSEKEMISLMELSNFSHSQTIELTESTKIIEGIK
jgi:ubiquinone/menaquinone biosynthesis C-methylase UbiE